MAAAFPAGYERYVFPETAMASATRRPVLRRRADGPVVIVMHELPGLTATTVAIADAIWERGFTVVLPVFLGRPRMNPSLVRTLGNVARVCVAREFGALARGETGTIVDWLDALAESEERQSGLTGVGVVGMCLTGGFALAMARQSRVNVVVASQPSLPLALPGRRADVGVSAADFACIQERAGNGLAVRGLRYQRDPISPGARLRRIGSLKASATVEIPTCWPWKHSVLSNALDAADGSELARALSQTLDFLEAHLPVAPAS